MIRKFYAEIDKNDTNAKKQAEMSSITKGQFLAYISHEIRTPMNGILGFLQLLEKTALTAEQSMLVNNMKISSLLLNNVMNDILDMSKLETGEITLEVIPFNLYAAVEDAVVMFTPSAYNKKTTVDLFIGSDTPEYVVGDPTRLKQIISNLLSNAIKFTEQGWVSIEVSLEETLKSVFKVMFKIKDNGIGMARNTVDHLFESFLLEDNSTEPKYWNWH